MADPEYSAVPKSEPLGASELLSVPRDADFPDSATGVGEFLRRYTDFLPHIMFLFLVFPIACPLSRLIVYIFIVPKVVGIRSAFIARIDWEQSLYTHDIATFATVTSLTRNQETDGYWFHWEYSKGQNGNTPRDNLTSSTDIGDQFWVIYDPQDPSPVFRWDQFDSSGHLATIDQEL